MIDHIMRCPITHDIPQNAEVAADGHTHNETAYDGKQMPANGDGRVQDQVAE